MNRFVAPFTFKFFRGLVAVVCSLIILPGDMSVLAPQLAAAQDQPAAAKLPPEQLDSLVAPIALYPDPLLSQTLVASTYPLEIIQLQQWLGQHKDLKDQALADAVIHIRGDSNVAAHAALRGPSFVRERFGISRMIAETLAAYGISVPVRFEAAGLSKCTARSNQG